MIEQLFGSRTRVKLLKLFLNNPEKAFFVREVGRKVNEQINSVRRELENLVKLEILLTEDKDRKKYFIANQNFILFPELKSLILKAQISLEQDLVRAIQRIGQIRYLVLTGNFVSLPGIKTDMLMVGRINRRRLRRVLNKFRKIVSHDINYTVMSLKEFNYRNDLTDKFLYDILENKKIVVIDKLFSKY